VAAETTDDERRTLPGVIAAPRTRVVVAQPHGLMHEALTRLLESAGLEVAGCCPCSSALAECLAVHGPDVVLVDDQFDDVLSAIADTRRVLPAGRVVVLAAAIDPALARETLTLEVDAVLLKTSTCADVIRALERVVAGDTVFPAGWLRAGRLSEMTPPRLSRRQREVLELLSQGLSNEAIAARLFISTNTVKFHIAAIYTRLGVRNRVEAARALSEG
jgi:DNA-binding NarL/FixJ family response regulator